MNDSENKLWALLLYDYGSRGVVQGNLKMGKPQKGVTDDAKGKLGGVPLSLEETATPIPLPSLCWAVIFQTAVFLTSIYLCN